MFLLKTFFHNCRCPPQGGTWSAYVWVTLWTVRLHCQLISYEVPVIPVRKSNASKSERCQPADCESGGFAGNSAFPLYLYRVLWQHFDVFLGAGYSLYIFQKRWSFAVFSKHNPLSHSQDGAACKQRALDFPWAGTISSGNRCCQNPQLDEMFWTPFTKTVRVYGKHHRGCAETVRADLVEKTPGKVGQDPNKHFTWYSRSTSDALEKTSIWANDWVFLGASSRILYIYRLYI